MPRRDYQIEQRIIHCRSQPPPRRLHGRRRGHRTWRRSPGGLVTALEPVLQANQGTWIGWAGQTGPAPEPFEADGIRLLPVELSADEVKRYYEGFSNASLWPLYHDAVEPRVFRRSWWKSYLEVNTRFAEVCAAEAAPGAVVWIQDYQLQLVPAMLRERRPDLRIGFFLHIPFPPVELFMQLPHRMEILKGSWGPTWWASSARWRPRTSSR
ncbi:hypothetical protein GCM10029992_60160 [Glycomyces albus]